MVKTRSQAGRLAYYTPRNHAARGTLSNRKKHRINKALPGTLDNLLAERLNDPEYIRRDNLMLDCQERRYFDSRISNDNTCYRKAEGSCNGGCMWVMKGNQGYCRRRTRQNVKSYCQTKLQRVLYG